MCVSFSIGALRTFLATMVPILAIGIHLGCGDGEAAPSDTAPQADVAQDVDASPEIVPGDSTTDSMEVQDAAVTGPTPGALGGACGPSQACDDGMVCADTEPFPGGMCHPACTGDAGPGECGANAICVKPEWDDRFRCYLLCDTVQDCRPGWLCPSGIPPGFRACVPR